MKLILMLILAASLQAYSFDAAKEWKNNCAACHLVGGGDKIGPDLGKVTERRTKEWLVKFLKYPTGMMQGDPEEPGYEKPDPLAKKLYEFYKPQLMAAELPDGNDAEKMYDYLVKTTKGIAPKGKIVEFQKKHGGKTSGASEKKKKSKAKIEKKKDKKA